MISLINLICFLFLAFIFSVLGTILFAFALAAPVPTGLAVVAVLAIGRVIR